MLASVSAYKFALRNFKFSNFGSCIRSFLGELAMQNVLLPGLMLTDSIIELSENFSDSKSRGGVFGSCKGGVGIHRKDESL